MKQRKKLLNWNATPGALLTQGLSASRQNRKKINICWSFFIYDKSKLDSTER
jgi:hypothetical protein